MRINEIEKSFVKQNKKLQKPGKREQTQLKMQFPEASGI
jgi:hypothetical protein